MSFLVQQDVFFLKLFLFLQIVTIFINLHVVSIDYIEFFINSEMVFRFH